MKPFFHDLDGNNERSVVLDDQGQVLTYPALLKKADAIGQLIQPRSVVLVLCKNTVDCLAGYIGILRAGGVPLLVHHSIRPEQRVDIVARFKPNYLYLPDDDGCHRLIPATSEQVRQDIHSNLALLLPTSGTTGSRNFVRLSTRNLHANAKSIIEYLSIGKDDRPITTMPMNYAYGLSILHSHLLAGASIVLTEHSVVSPNFWRLLDAHDVTTFGGVPFIYETLRKLRFGDMQLPHLKYLTQAGGKLATDTANALTDIAVRKSFRFIVMYGQTEATSRISYLSHEFTRSKLGSIGRPIPGVSLELIDSDGKVIEKTGERGELVCRGDNVSMGYASDTSDLARPDENRGRLLTGDIAWRDQEGFYYIEGRKKRFLKLFGHRVNLDEMEALLRRADHDCACAGHDDRLRIFIAGGEPARVKADVTNLTGLHQQGVEVVQVPTICRSESGKIDYARLESQRI